MSFVQPPCGMSPVVTRRFELEAPFSFKTTFRKPSHFPTPLEAFPDARTYYVAASVGGNLVGVRAESVRPETVDLTVYAEQRGRGLDAEVVVGEVGRRLGLSVDVSGFATLWKDDPQLSTLPAELSGGRPAMPHSLYGFLMICVFLQNTRVRRTVQMMEAMLDRFPRRLHFPDGVSLPTLWRPEDVLTSSEEELRSLKLGYRARTVWRLSQQFAQDPLIEKRLLAVGSAADLDSRLRELYGVGPATAGYLCFEWFKKLDHLVHISPWEAKILGRLVRGSDGADAVELIEECRRRWSPFTNLAAHALFESVFWMRAEGVGPRWLDQLVRL